MLIDTHAHLTMNEFSADLDRVIERAHVAGVEIIVNASFDMESSIRSVELADKFPDIFASVGIHPHHSDTVSEESIAGLKEIARNKKVVAIGETGLDYFENPIPKDIQRQAFIDHITLAKELNLPIILHGRESGNEMLEIIEKRGGSGLRGVFHCFSEDESYAQRALDLGFNISFTGIITFKNANKMREVVKYVPLEKILIETDCPYLSPQAFRGKRNEPSYVKIVAEKIAEIKNIAIEDVASTTTENAKKLFKI